MTDSTELQAEVDRLQSEVADLKRTHRVIERPSALDMLGQLMVSIEYYLDEGPALGHTDDYCHDHECCLCFMRKCYIIFSTEGETCKRGSEDELASATICGSPNSSEPQLLEITLRRHAMEAVRNGCRITIAERDGIVGEEWQRGAS